VLGLAESHLTDGAFTIRVSGHAGKYRQGPSHDIPSSADAVKASLQPGQAVAALNERVKRVGKINLEIADWLQVSPFSRGV
jgi:hypothetical protein